MWVWASIAGHNNYQLDQSNLERYFEGLWYESGTSVQQISINPYSIYKHVFFSFQNSILTAHAIHLYLWPYISLMGINVCWYVRSFVKMPHPPEDLRCSRLISNINEMTILIILYVRLKKYYHKCLHGFWKPCYLKIIWYSKYSDQDEPSEHQTVNISIIIPKKIKCGEKLQNCVPL